MRQNFSLFLAVMLLSTGVWAQQAAPAPRAPLLILGTGHLDNPGRDMNNTHVDDVLTAKRQAELTELVRRVVVFKPTRVAIECDPSQQAKWTARYAAYRAGKYTLTRDERDQVGLRLAAMQNLPSVDCVDFQGEPPGPEDAYDFQAYAAKHGQQAALDALMAAGKAHVTAESEFLTTHSLVDWYKRLNQPAALKADNAMYFRFAAIGGDDAHPGAAWVGGWHARNLIIVENIRRITEPGIGCSRSLARGTPT